LWRYASLVPVAVPEVETGPLFNLGGTPLQCAPRVAERVGAGEVWIKDDGALPTGSLKDRASAVVAMRARELDVSRVITASTGNAGVAMAAMARAAGIEAVVLVPGSAPAGKIAQLLVFGARLVLVDGTYDDAFSLSRAAADELGWYCRNTGYNPFTVEGKKTVAFEICEQLDPTPGFAAPDVIYVSVGDGNIITGVHKGLRELKALGWIERMPRLVGVQATGSAAIANAFASGGDEIQPVAAHTVADSISADRPSDGLRALRAARDTGGHYVTVTDEQILAAIPALGRAASVFAEPAAAAAYAGLLEDAEAGRIGKDDRVVVLCTGNGLKDVRAAEAAVEAPAPIAPDVKTLLAALR
jgi:threonine synthase